MVVFELWRCLLCSVLQPCSPVSEAFSRWASPHNPDVGTHKTGEQLEAIRAFLPKHTEILYVWFDFGCLPQREKDSSGVVLKSLNLAEEAYFGWALSLVNLLYLSANVLILLDGEYNTRFRCLYETFLSGHKFDGPLWWEISPKQVRGSVRVTKSLPPHSLGTPRMPRGASGSVFIQSATNWDINVAFLGKTPHMARLRLASTHLFFFSPGDFP